MIFVKSKYLNKNLILLVFIIYLIHTFTIKFAALAAVISIIELVAVLMFLIFKPRLFLLSSILLVSGSFDVGEFIDGKDSVAYYIGSLPIVKGYLWLFLITILYYIRRTNKQFLKRVIANPLYKRAIKITDYIIFIGVIMGIICVLCNDNNIININWIRYFFYDFVAYAVIPMTGICLLYDISLYGYKYILQLQQLLIAILLCIPVCALLAAICGLFGTYGGEQVLLAPLNLFLAPTIIFFAFYKNYHLKGIAIFGFMISMFLQLFYSNALGGKSWLSLVYILLMSMVILYKRGHKRAVFNTVTMLVVMIIGFSGYFITTIKSKGSESHSMSKLNQAVMLLSFTDALWYSNLPLSPRNRIEEFVNVALEFKNKPQTALLGKGFSGSTKDHIPFSIINDSAYSEDQYYNHSFISLHETLNNTILKFGIFGLIFLFVLFMFLVKQLNQNPWSAVGALWLLFFYGYSGVLGMLGISCIILSVALSQPQLKEQSSGRIKTTR